MESERGGMAGWCAEVDGGGSQAYKRKSESNDDGGFVAMELLSVSEELGEETEAM